MDRYGFYLTKDNWESNAYTAAWKIKKKDVFYNHDYAINEIKRRYGYHTMSQYLKDDIA